MKGFVKSRNIFNSDLWISGAVVISCLFLYSVFPTEGVFQKMVSSFAFLLAIPFLYVKIILKKNRKEFGLSFDNWKTGLVWLVICLIFSLLILYVFINYFNFLEKYPFPNYLSSKFIFFVLYEIFLVGFFAALYEFFFRGFLMLIFSKKIGIWSILLQAAAFFSFIVLAGGIRWSLAPFLIFSLFSGIVAYFSSSIIYSFLASLIFNIILDTVVIYLAR